MNNKLTLPVHEIFAFLPSNFFHKSINEKFIKLVIQNTLGFGEWVKGNPDNKEPDYIFNNIPFEFTLASDKCKNNHKNNFINKLRKFNYNSDDTEDDLIKYIEQQIEDKSKKRYSLQNIHLCILCLIEQVNWISDKYGSCTHILTSRKRILFFNKIKSKYINTKIFSNIFIIFPDMSAKWWVWDILSDNKISLQVTPAMIESKKFPFFIEKRLYKLFVDKGLLFDTFNILDKKDT